MLPLVLLVRSEAHAEPAGDLLRARIGRPHHSLEFGVGLVCDETLRRRADDLLRIPLPPRAWRQPEIDVSICVCIGLSGWRTTHTTDSDQAIIRQRVRHPIAEAIAMPIATIQVQRIHGLLQSLVACLRRMAVCVRIAMQVGVIVDMTLHQRLEPKSRRQGRGELDRHGPASCLVRLTVRETASVGKF
jgi:hypothetical protein